VIRGTDVPGVHSRREARALRCERVAQRGITTRARIEAIRGRRAHKTTEAFVISPHVRWWAPFRSLGHPEAFQGGKYSMRLALVIISESEFDEIFNHMTSHPSGYRNMHMREMRQEKSKDVLRYLHAMYALDGPVKKIEGMISGPRVFAHYMITRRSARHSQINDLDTSGDPKEFARLQEQFLPEITKRVKQEKASRVYASNRLPGRYYLQRRFGGIPATAPICQEAVASKVLHQDFVAQLEPWDLLLFRPR
jgi:hypothetical protein